MFILNLATKATLLENEKDDCGFFVGLETIGVPKEPLPHLVDQLVKRIREIIGN